MFSGNPNTFAGFGASAVAAMALIGLVLGAIALHKVNNHDHDRPSVYLYPSSTTALDPSAYSHIILDPKPDTTGNLTTLGAADDGTHLLISAAPHTTSSVSLPVGQLILSSDGPDQHWVKLGHHHHWKVLSHSGNAAPTFAPKNSFTCLGDLYPGGAGNTSNLTSALALSYNGSRLFFGTANERPGDFVVWQYSEALSSYQYHSRVTVTNQTGNQLCSVIDVSAAGDRVICGSPDDFSGTGAFWIWHWNENTGVWDAELEATVPDGAGASAAVGTTVVMSATGHVVFVYAPGYSSNAGAYYIYTRNTDTNVWTLGEAVTDITRGASGSFTTSVNSSTSGATMSKDGKNVFVTYYASTGASTYLHHHLVSYETGLTVASGTGVQTIATLVGRSTVLTSSHDGGTVTIAFSASGGYAAFVASYEKSALVEQSSTYFRTIGDGIAQPTDFDGSAWATDVKLAHSGRMWCVAGTSHAANASNVGAWCYYLNEQLDAFRPVQLTKLFPTDASDNGNCGSGAVGLSGDGRRLVIGCPLNEEACVSS